MIWSVKVILVINGENLSLSVVVVPLTGPAGSATTESSRSWKEWESRCAYLRQYCKLPHSILLTTIRRAYYERNNFLIIQYLYMDSLLDSDLPPNLIKKHTHLPDLFMLDKGSAAEHSRPPSEGSLLQRIETENLKDQISRPPPSPKKPCTVHLAKAPHWYRGLQAILICQNLLIEMTAMIYSGATIEKWMLRMQIAESEL